MSYKTEQENFWAGQFGNEYIARNKSKEGIASNIHFFSVVFDKIKRPDSLIEFGANIGMNLRAIHQLFPNVELSAIEINESAAKELEGFLGQENVINDSILTYQPTKHYDVSLIKGVLIHINPAELVKVYDNLYNSSNRYIIVAEYFNPTPVTISYRGHNDRLFKRDFAGELLDRFDDLELVDYGFCYKRDKAFPQDNINWFLLEKR